MQQRAAACGIARPSGGDARAGAAVAGVLPAAVAGRLAGQPGRDPAGHAGGDAAGAARRGVAPAVALAAAAALTALIALLQWLADLARRGLACAGSAALGRGLPACSLPRLGLLPLPWRCALLALPLVLPLLWPAVARPPEGRFELVVARRRAGHGGAGAHAHAQLLLYDAGPRVRARERCRPARRSCRCCAPAASAASTGWCSATATPTTSAAPSRCVRRCRSAAGTARSRPRTRCARPLHGTSAARPASAGRGTACEFEFLHPRPADLRARDQAQRDLVRAARDRRRRAQRAAHRRHRARHRRRRWSRALAPRCAATCCWCRTTAADLVDAMPSRCGAAARGAWSRPATATASAIRRRRCWRATATRHHGGRQRPLRRLDMARQALSSAPATRAAALLASRRAIGPLGRGTKLLPLPTQEKGRP